MTKQILLKTSFCITGIILLFFSLCTDKVNAQSAVTINWEESKTQWNINMGFGVTVSGSLDQGTTNSLMQNFSQKGLYLKINDPDNSLINNTNFQSLNSSGFKWYFFFGGDPSPFLSAFFSKYPSGNPVVEVADADTAKNIKNSYPNARVHVGNFSNWPRGQVNDILSQVAPPTIEAVSFRAVVNGNPSVFRQIKDIFDTVFDATMNIPGTDGVVINFPSGTKIALSDVSYNTINPVDRSIYQNGLVASALYLSARSLTAPKAVPFTYYLAGDFSQFSDSDKKMLAEYLDMINENDEIFWPKHKDAAYPWDTGSSNPTVPIVGVVGNKGSNYRIFLTNTGSQPVTVNFSRDIGLNNYSFYSNIRGSGSFSLSGNQIQLVGRESLVGRGQGSGGGGGGDNPIPSNQPAYPSAVPATNKPNQPGLPTKIPGQPYNPAITYPPDNSGHKGNIPFVSPGKNDRPASRQPDKNISIFNVFGYIGKLWNSVISTIRSFNEKILP